MNKILNYRRRRRIRPDHIELGKEKRLRTHALHDDGVGQERDTAAEFPHRPDRPAAPRRRRYHAVGLDKGQTSRRTGHRDDQLCRDTECRVGHKLGAFDYLEKPVNPRILKEKIEQAMQNAPLPSPRVSVSQKKQRDGDEDRDGNRVGNIVYGESPASKQLYDYIRIVAPTNMSVLIVGESGTGKEHAAHMIHEYSPRSAAPFIAVDCGSLSREAARDLKGAFTSAVANKKGVFEVANGGTVFLDEVGNLPYDYRYSCCAPCRSVRYARSAQPTISLSTYASSLPPTKISKRPLRPDGFGKTCTTDLMNSCCECLPCGNGTATCRDTWNISWKTPTRN